MYWKNVWKKVIFTPDDHGNAYQWRIQHADAAGYSDTFENALSEIQKLTLDRLSKIEKAKKIIAKQRAIVKKLSYGMKENNESQF